MSHLTNHRSPSLPSSVFSISFSHFPRCLKAGSQLYSSLCIQISPTEGERKKKKKQLCTVSRREKNASNAFFFFFKLGVVLLWDIARDAGRSEPLMTLAELLHELPLPLHHDRSFSFSWSLPGCLQDRLHCNTCLQYSKHPLFSGYMLLEMWSSTTPVHHQSPVFFDRAVFVSPISCRAVGSMSDSHLNHFPWC